MDSIDKKTPSNYYTTQTPYAITINPIDKYQFVGRPNREYLFSNLILSIVQPMKHNLILYKEISEPHQMVLQGKLGPRLHLHGVITFDSKTKLKQFLLHDMYSLLRIASVDIDTIEDLDHWLSYCSKQSLLQKPRLI